ncbi:MAG: S8 family serine peptidase [Pseudomonadales bacterium]|nr:S8 family serine peptidase [Pseudomonadales bacterium]
MELLTRAILITFAALAIASCGGGGGGGGDDDHTGDTDPGPEPDRGGTRPTTYSISGKVLPAYAIDVDYDTNDPASGSRSNDNFAQPISNVVTLHGFASKDATNYYGDRFGAQADEYDFYQVRLQRGQAIQLQVVDWEQFDWWSGSNSNGDLDLHLYDETWTHVDTSDSVDEFEHIIVPEDGEYYVAVEAWSGISKYILQIAPVSSGQSAANQDIKTNRLDFVSHQMIVKYKEQTPVKTMALHAGSVAIVPLEHSNETSERAVLATFPQADNTLQAFSSSINNRPANLIQQLEQNNPESYEKYLTLRAIKTHRLNPNVEYASPNYRVHPTATPNDTHYSYQWHYPLINLPQAWDITTGARAGSPVIVAVIDTGVITGFSEIRDQLVPGYDFIRDPSMSRDGNGIDSNPDDVGDSSNRGQSSWHGTHVAGTVAADSNNNSGVAGVAWNAKIMPIRALGAGGGTSYDILQSILFAAGLPNDSGTVPAQKADIINMSLGGSQFVAASQEAIQQARNAGVIVVAAAGNENTSAPSYPASYPGVISVSAMDLNRQRAPYSNYGNNIDIGAPGGNIRVDLNGDRYSDGVLSVVADDTSGTREEVFTFYNGTSMAAPHVAGVIALMRAVHPDITPAQVDALLADGSLTDDLGAPGWDQIYGYGFINALKAVQAARNLADGGTNPDPHASMAVNPTSIALGGLRDSAQFNVYKQGDAPLSIVRIDSNRTWLDTSPVSVDTEGFGEYQLDVLRSGLSAGSHQGTLTLIADDNSEVRVNVTLQQGTTTIEGDIAKPYVFLVTADDYEIIAYQEANLANNQWHYQFEKVAKGEYYVLASSDIDYNGGYCDSGEACGSYPSLGDYASITVTDGARIDIDITMDLDTTTTDSSSAGTNTGNTGSVTIRGSLKAIEILDQLRVISGDFKSQE